MRRIAFTFRLVHTVKVEVVRIPMLRGLDETHLFVEMVRDGDDSPFWLSHTAAYLHPQDRGRYDFFAGARIALRKLIERAEGAVPEEHRRWKLLRRLIQIKLSLIEARFYRDSMFGSLMAEVHKAMAPHTAKINDLLFHDDIAQEAARLMPATSYDDRPGVYYQIDEPPPVVWSNVVKDNPEGERRGNGPLGPEVCGDCRASYCPDPCEPPQFEEPLPMVGKPDKLGDLFGFPVVIGIDYASERDRTVYVDSEGSPPECAECRGACFPCPQGDGDDGSEGVPSRIKER